VGYKNNWLTIQLKYGLLHIVATVEMRDDRLGTKYVIIVLQAHTTVKHVLGTDHELLSSFINISMYSIQDITASYMTRLDYIASETTNES
jgi:hypothetical protein